MTGLTSTTTTDFISIIVLVSVSINLHNGKTVLDAPIYYVHMNFNGERSENFQEGMRTNLRTHVAYKLRVWNMEHTVSYRLSWLHLCLHYTYHCCITRSESRLSRMLVICWFPVYFLFLQDRKSQSSWNTLLILFLCLWSGCFFNFYQLFRYACKINQYGLFGKNRLSKNTFRHDINTPITVAMIITSSYISHSSCILTSCVFLRHACFLM